MQRLWCLAVIAITPLAGCGTLDDGDKVAEELNVNSRYIIENVGFSGGGWRTDISPALRGDLDSVVGAKYDDSTLRTLADRIKKELRGADVKVNVTRGTEPDSVVVNFEVREQKFDMLVGKFAYNSKEGWTGDGSATTSTHGNAFTLGLLSDSDSQIERFAGVRAIFARDSVGTKRLKFRFEFDDYHDQWNRPTLEAAPATEIYRSRQDFMPEATVVLFQPLEWSFGVSFARLSVPGSVQTESAGAAAAKTVSANAVVNTLRYHQRWGTEKDPQQQEVTANYTASAALSTLGSDDVFTKHQTQGHYRYRRGRSSVAVGFLAGVIEGDAPLYERFVLGDSTTLRGWSKFDLDPLGGSHVVHGSIDYQYRIFQVFYDAGAIWDRPEDRDSKQSAGVGFKKEYFQLAVAFPMKTGRVSPIFYAGMNF
jgi:Omp85 superfamily domain